MKKSTKKVSSKPIVPPVYDPAKIEPKWQKKWDSQKLYVAKEKKGARKFYGLIEFPYPSGEGLHIGHIRSNTAMDIITRKRRSEGFDVLYPIGWDAFGLPTENYAIKTGIQPAVVTKKNTDTFRRQLKALGFGFDWTREVNTTDPKYFKWTQWIFLQFLKRGLAYKKKMSINWCPKDLIGLANEEVINGLCERCGTPVEKREKEQWMLAITRYAERLLNDLDLPELNWLEKIKDGQRNWIGKSEGAEIKFKVHPPSLKLRRARSESFSAKATEDKECKVGDIKVFTTRPDTLFGVTYVVLAPEHEMVKALMDSIENRIEVEAYIAKAKKESDIERTDATKEKTGVELKGVFAINPVNEEKIPVWIADYVLADYGTGAVMAVPAHDLRDWDFAKKYGLPIRQVVVPENADKNTNSEKCFDGAGNLVNSKSFDGKDSRSVILEITKFAGGEWVTKFKLRDWIFSRQRYWGEPIPVIHCPSCAIKNPASKGIVPVPEKDLPVTLPKVKNYEPTETGESPLALVSSWVNVKCPVCKGPAKRETDTMPNWAGSSWYYLRYADPKNSKKFADFKKLQHWTPVDWYNGGMEHTTLHLLYSRFWHKFLFDLGLVPTTEPYLKRTSHGLILAEGGVKMSKSKGNVINPDDLVKSVGADTLRVYEMFMGPFDQPIAWDTNNIAGSRRFIERVWRLRERVGGAVAGDDSDETCGGREGGRAGAAALASADSGLGGTSPATATTSSSNTIARLIQKTIKKVGDDIEAMRFNTAISALMITLNEMEKVPTILRADYENLLKLLAPFAPHVTEELWAALGNKKSIHLESWPKYDPALAADSESTIVVQINGKMRASFKAESGESREELERMARALPEISKWISGHTVTKVVIVSGRLVNIVLTE